jgi:glycosyl transferase family 25
MITTKSAINTVKIFVITLSDENERQIFIETQLNAAGLPFEFFYGIDGKRLEPEDINSSYDAEKCGNYYRKRAGTKKNLTIGEIGCSLSHRSIYNKIVKENIQRAIILEDDVIVNGNFKTVVDLLNNINIDGYIIKLDVPSSDKIKTSVLPWHKIKLNHEYCLQQTITSLSFTWGYYIDIKAAVIMNNLTEKIFLPADEWEYYMKYTKLRILNKNIISCDDSFVSIIGNRQFDQEYGFSCPVQFIKKFSRFFSKIFQSILH